MDEDAVMSDVEGEEEAYQEGGGEDEKVQLPKGAIEESLRELFAPNVANR